MINKGVKMRQRFYLQLTKEKLEFDSLEEAKNMKRLLANKGMETSMTCRTPPTITRGKA